MQVICAMGGGTKMDGIGGGRLKASADESLAWLARPKYPKQKKKEIE